MGSVATRIRKILADRGYTQRELARRAGLAETHVNKIIHAYEESADANVEMRTLQAIARAGGVSERWLITGDGTPDDDAPAPPPHTDDRTPKLGNAANWPALIAGAKKEAPDLDEWVWIETQASHPLATVPLTVSVVVDIARFINKHMPPPAGATKPPRRK